MRTKREIDLTSLGRYAVPSNHVSTVGRVVRFLKPCPVDGRCVYTLVASKTHHRLRVGQLARVTFISPEGLMTLAVKHRERPVYGVPLDVVELMPKPLTVVGPLTAENVLVGAHVEFALECPVNGRSFFANDISHHMIDAGTSARVVHVRSQGCVDVVIAGRVRPVRAVPFEHFDLMGEEPTQEVKP